MRRSVYSEILAKASQAEESSLNSLRNVKRLTVGYSALLLDEVLTLEGLDDKDAKRRIETLAGQAIGYEVCLFACERQEHGSVPAALARLNKTKASSETEWTYGMPEHLIVFSRAFPKNIDLGIPEFTDIHALGSGNIRTTAYYDFHGQVKVWKGGGQGGFGRKPFWLAVRPVL
jgi:hypothetical protein